MTGQEIQIGKRRGGNEVICHSGKGWRDCVREKDRLLCIDFVYLNNSTQPTLLEEVGHGIIRLSWIYLFMPAEPFLVREVHAFLYKIC